MRLDELTPANRMTWATVRAFGVLRWAGLLLTAPLVGILNGIDFWGDRRA